MKRNVKYKQCFIGREAERWTAWLPLSLARVGKVIVPKGEAPAEVLEAYDGALVNHEDLLDMSVAHKYHRKNTDI